MRLITLSFLFTLGKLVFAQDPFERIITMPGALEIAGVAMDDEGNFVMASVHEDNIQVTRLAPNGDHVWTKKYPLFTEEGFYGNSIAVGPQGILVAGYTMGALTNARDGLLMRIGLDGTLLSAKRVDALGGSNAFHCLRATSDGFIASGRADAGGNLYDMLLAKLDHEGTIQWMRTYGTPGWDWGFEAIPLASGGYAVIGYADSLDTGFSPSAYLVRTDAMGNELWARSISCGAGRDEGYCVAESSSGDLYVGGRSLGYFTGDISAFVTKVSSTGAHVWTRVLEQGIETVSLAATDDGGVTWLAHPQFIAGGPGDYELAWGTFGADGTLVDTKFYGGTGSDNGTALFALPDGGLAVLGFSNSYSTEWSGLMIRTDADLNAACNNIELDLEWTNAVARVTPYTSLTWSGFTVFDYNLGSEEVVVNTLDPCCAVLADFEATSDGFEWTFTNTSTGSSSFQWDFGDGNVSEETSPVHTYAENGTYRVCLIAFGDCGEPIFCQEIATTVGVAEAAIEHDIAVFPSPAQQAFTVSSNGARIQGVRIHDAHGRLVRNIAAVNSQRVSVDASGLPSGVYMVRTLLAGGGVVNSRVVIH